MEDTPTRRIDFTRLLLLIFFLIETYISLSYWVLSVTVVKSSEETGSVRLVRTRSSSETILLG